MKIKVVESKTSRITTELRVTAHVIATYDEVSEKDYPEFEFGYYDYEKRKINVAKEMTKWELEIGPNEADVAKFEEVFADDSYFEDEADGETGVIEIYIKVNSAEPLSDKDKQYISESAVEYIVDDANVTVGGTWYGEEEYWDGYSYEPSYRDASGELSESATVRLDNSIPISYEVL